MSKYLSNKTTRPCAVVCLVISVKYNNIIWYQHLKCRNQTQTSTDLRSMECLNTPQTFRQAVFLAGASPALPRTPFLWHSENFIRTPISVRKFHCVSYVKITGKCESFSCTKASVQTCNCRFFFKGIVSKTLRSMLNFVTCLYYIFLS